MNTFLRSLFAALLVALAAAGLRAEKPVNTSTGGLAIQGVDPVAYFSESKPVRGSAEFTHEWNGAKWCFASAANRDAFAGNPEKFAPQFGGYCAWAVSRGYTAGFDPEAWSIVGGKLYLNYNLKVRQRWEEDAAGNIAKGEQNWPAILAK